MVEVVVDEEMELVVGVMAFVYDSLSHDMFLDIGLDLQNLHISFRPPLKYTVNYNTYIYYTHTHKIKWAFCLCIPLQKSMFDTVLTALLHDERSLDLAYAQNYDGHDCRWPARCVVTAQIRDFC